MKENEKETDLCRKNSSVVKKERSECVTAAHSVRHLSCCTDLTALRGIHAVVIFILPLLFHV